MSFKTPVSALEEFCTKYKSERPKYIITDSEDGSFTCNVKLLEMEAFGNARTKRESKHLAANNLMSKLTQESGQPHINDSLHLYQSTMISGEDGFDIGGKNPISVLQEYCDKYGILKPDYFYRASDESGFICTVNVLEMEAKGSGRTKRDAKYAAAVNIIRKIQNLPEKLPLPTIEIVEKKSAINVPEIGNSVKRNGESISTVSKNAEYEIPDIDLGLELISINNIMDDTKSTEKHIFNAYRNITSSGPLDCEKVFLCDRHNYFKSFPYSKKSTALSILQPSNDANYKSEKDRALSVISALGITPSITNLSVTILDQMIQIELICDLDCVFIGREDEIYGNVLQYFREMLI